MVTSFPQKASTLQPDICFPMIPNYKQAERLDFANPSGCFSQGCGAADSASQCTVASGWPATGGLEATPSQCTAASGWPAKARHQCPLPEMGPTSPGLVSSIGGVGAPKPGLGKTSAGVVRQCRGGGVVRNNEG